MAYASLGVDAPTRINIGSSVNPIWVEKHGSRLQQLGIDNDTVQVQSAPVSPLKTVLICAAIGAVVYAVVSETKRK